MNKDIKCAQCGKKIGERIAEGSINSPMGAIPLMRMKMDYRKAARLAVRVKWGEGICKACARKIFPEGKSYRVNFMYHGKENTIDHCIGGMIWAYATKAEAEEACEEMNRRKNGTVYYVKEYRL